MTAGDKAECKEIARTIVEEVLIRHITNCPHHQAYLVSKARTIGFVLGMIVVSDVSSGTVTAIVMKAMGV